jgi:hypothetical protein
MGAGPPIVPKSNMGQVVETQGFTDGLPFRNIVQMSDYSKKQRPQDLPPALVLH